jgi:hypothetical protein
MLRGGLAIIFIGILIDSPGFLAVVHWHKPAFLIPDAIASSVGKHAA